MICNLLASRTIQSNRIPDSGDVMQGHKELTVRQEAMDLVVAIYKLTKSIPKTEVYGLASQIR